jgi:hypothetical protein
MPRKRRHRPVLPLTIIISFRRTRRAKSPKSVIPALVKGISGSVKKTYSVDKAVLQFGRLRQDDQDITAFDMTAMSDGAGTEVSGFLGFVMLKFLDIKIDYRDGLVDFTYDRTQFDHF